MMRFGQNSMVILAACLMPALLTAQSTCSRSGVIKLQNAQYVFQMNENDSALEECVTVHETGFTITSGDLKNATNGPPAAYTSIYRGCHWGACTSSSPFPIQESNIASAEGSVTLTQPYGFNDDAAYDIWFNQTAATTGQPNGTEVMIWLNRQGTIQPFGSRVATATINGARYEVWTGKQSSWKIISYVASSPVMSVNKLNFLPFFEDAIARGSLDPSWWLIDIEFGFEIWTGGQGLAISDFGVNAAPRAAAASPDSKP